MCPGETSATAGCLSAVALADLFSCLRLLPSLLWQKVCLLPLAAPQPLAAARNILGRCRLLLALQVSSRCGTKAIFISGFVTLWQQLQFWELKYLLEVRAKHKAHHAMWKSGWKDEIFKNRLPASSPRKLVVFSGARDAACPADGHCRVQLCKVSQRKRQLRKPATRPGLALPGACTPWWSRGGEGESPGSMSFCAPCLTAC